MIRRVFIALVVLHGLIHLMGFAKGFGLAELSQLTQPISRAMGAVWLVAALLLLGTAVALVVAPRWWWVVGAVLGFLARGPWSLHAAYERAVAHAPPAGAQALLMDDDLAALPAPVRRYVRAAGVIGKPRVHDFRATWTGRIRASATAPWMAFVAEQHNTIDPPRRFFMMDARMKGLPVAVLHAFGAEGATMRVKLLSAFGMVNAAGPDLTRGETVTIFNDLCLFAPGALVSPAITWEPIDDRAARAHFTLGANTISAELRFDASDQLIDFVSDDRGAASSDGRTFTTQRWTTPVRDYAQVGPARVATHGETRWHPATGAWTYGEFALTALAYDVAPRA